MLAIGASIPPRPTVRLLMVWLSLLILALASPARGQMVTGEIVSVGLGGSGGDGGLYRQGCYVPVQVLLTNTSGRNFDVYLSVQEVDPDGDKILSLSRRLTLNAADARRSFWFYYWPAIDDDGRGTRSVVVLDGNRNPLTTLTVPEGHRGLGLSPVDDLESHSNRLVVLLGNKADGFENYVAASEGGSNYGARGGNATVRFTGVGRADDFPDDVQGLDGVDVVIWSCQNVPVADMRDEFQLKALLDWVRMGGHLIVTAGTQYADLQDPRHAALRDALPMRFTGTRQLEDTQVLRQLARHNVAPLKLTQAIGVLAPGAHAVDLDAESLRQGAPPLLVSRCYGAGVISLLTVDLASPDMEGALTENQWLVFWQHATGWGGSMMTNQQAKQHAAEAKTGSPGTQLTEAQLDADIPAGVDLTGQTALRLVLALFFLAIYWAAAGPVGHVVLRAYKRTHWSWWIFGATVVAASGVATTAVSLMRLGHYELKHRTYVLGAVGHGEAAVVAYYGLFAPTDHRVKVSLPEGQGYIVPLTDPLAARPLPFADPQTYTLENGTEAISERDRSGPRPHSISYPARTTLKKLQARWYGSLATATTFGSLDGRVRRNVPPAGLDKVAAAEAIQEHPLAGLVRNRTAYTLREVTVIAYGDQVDLPHARIYDLGRDWAPDTDVILEKDLHQRAETAKVLDPLARLVDVVARSYAHSKTTGVPLVSSDGLSADDRTLAATQSSPAEFLSMLLDMRENLGPRDLNRVELVRHFARTVDRTATLRAGHVLFLAVVKKKSESDKAVLPSPLALTVDGTRLEGDGEVCFAWSAEVE